MKTILILAAVLMGGASIYGIVDYRKRSATKEFRQLYTKENPATQPDMKTVATEADGSTLQNNADKMATTKNEVKPVIRKKKIRKFRFSEFSRAALVPIEKPDTVLMKKDTH